MVETIFTKTTVISFLLEQDERLVDIKRLENAVLMLDGVERFNLVGLNTTGIEVSVHSCVNLTLLRDIIKRHIV